MISASFDQPVASMVWLIRASFLTGMTQADDQDWC